MVTFLPDCEQLLSSHVNYIVRLAGIISIDIFGGCKELFPSNLKKIIPSFPDKLKLVGLYQYILVWEPFNDPYYVSEAFFESLVYPSMPVVMGAKDLKPYLPDDYAVVNAREFSDSPQGLVRHLQLISENEWTTRLIWKKMVNNRKPSFGQLWDWSLESIICRVCQMSDLSLPTNAPELLPNHGSIDNAKLLMYLDQRRWYKEKKKNRKNRHARIFKDGVLV